MRIPLYYVLALLLIPPSICGCVRSGANEFLIRDSSGDTVIDLNDIEGYDWKSHTLTLHPGIREKIEERYVSTLVGGIRFEVVVDGAPVYEGTLTSSTSSFAHEGIILNVNSMDVDPNQVVIRMGYPSMDSIRSHDSPNSDIVKTKLIAHGKIFY